MKYFTILAVVVLTISNARSDSCVPNSVKKISLDSHFRLTWATSSEDCDVAEFIIDIHDAADELSYTYITNQSGLTLTPLHLCQNYTFNIRAISYDHVAGPTVKTELFTSISKDANLHISLSPATVTPEALTIKWNLQDDSLISCVSSYQVTYFNEDLDPRNVTQTLNEFTIYNPDLCMNYTFQVKAVVLDTDVSAPVAEESVTTMPNAPPSVPQLVRKDPYTTSADLVFLVPSYEEYRCEFYLFVFVVGVNYQQEYRIKIEKNINRTNPVTVHVDNLQRNYVYDVYVWEEDEAGKSDNVTFLLQTSDKKHLVYLFARKPFPCLDRYQGTIIKEAEPWITLDYISFSKRSTSGTYKET